jgi:hypothetical protein
VNFNMGLSYKFESLYFNSNININFPHSIFLQETAWLPTWQEQQQTQYNVDLKGFWRWCMLYRIHRIFLDFFHRPVFHWLRLALSKGPNWVGVSSPTFIWGRKQIQFPKCRVFWITGRWKKSRKILWILYSTM